MIVRMLPVEAVSSVLTGETVMACVGVVFAQNAKSIPQTSSEYMCFGCVNKAFL